MKFIKKTGQAIFCSKAYRKASSISVEYAKDPKKLIELIGDARIKADKVKEGPLKKVWDPLATLLRMLMASTRGGYQNISWQSRTAIVCTVVYFVFPADVIADLIPGGFIDDGLLIRLTLMHLKSDIDRYLSWETVSEGEEASE